MINCIIQFEPIINLRRIALCVWMDNHSKGYSWGTNYIWNVKNLTNMIIGCIVRDKSHFTLYVNIKWEMRNCKWRLFIIEPSHNDDTQVLWLVMLQQIFSFHNLYSVSPDVKNNEKQGKLTRWHESFLLKYSKHNQDLCVSVNTSKYTIYYVGNTISLCLNNLCRHGNL